MKEMGGHLTRLARRRNQKSRSNVNSEVHWKCSSSDSGAFSGDDGVVCCEAEDCCMEGMGVAREI